MERFRLGVVQLTSTDQGEFNLKLVEEFYLKGCADRADLVVFPENTLYFRIQSSVPLVGLTWNGPEMAQLQRLVDAHGSSALMVTTAVVSGPTQKLSNTTILFQPGLAPERAYTKMHLFDVDVPGAPAVRESDSFAGGSEPRLVEIKGWKFGMSICYDLRFSELYSKYAQKADVILVPSAFLVPTGEAHWHVLLRARAIENQCYVAAPAQSGEHKSGPHVRATYGHSLVVDPWGRVLAELEKSPQIQVVELNRQAISKVRQQIPMENHRRLK